VLHYPVRRGELMNFISFVERDDWQVESWTVAGTSDELANDFRGWHADVHAIIEKLDTPFKWALMVRGPMPCWSRGRIALLGEAVPRAGRRDGDRGRLRARGLHRPLRRRSAGCLRALRGDPARAHRRSRAQVARDARPGVQPGARRPAPGRRRRDRARLAAGA